MCKNNLVYNIRNNLIRSFLTLLLLMCTTITFAHSIEVANSDGKTIYYNYNSDGTSVSVTYKGTRYNSYYNEYSGEIVIPETITYSDKTYSVTSIGYAAFDGCWDLTSVTIPNSVTSIGYGAFDGCSGLTSVTIGNSVTSIDSYAFYDTRIKSLTIGTGIQTIASDAFDYRSSGGGAKPIKVIWLANTPPSGYKEVGGTINYVPNDSYSGLSNRKIYPFLSSMFEVDGIKYVPVSPSERTCDAIDCVYNKSAENTKIGNTVTYKNINMTVQSVGDSIFTGNTYIKTLEYDFDGSIGSSAFNGCSGLTSVTIGNSVTSIGSYAFSGCSGLKKVIVPDIKNWCRIKFGNIDANPLYYAHHLYSDENTEITKLIIPNDVTNINSCAFYGCSGLTSVTIPNSVTSIGSSAFSGCSGLKSITWNAKNYPTFSSYSSSPFYNIRTQITEFIIGDEMTSVPAYMCYGMINLKSVTIPNSVTSIEVKTFSNCSSLTSVTIPNSVTSISSSAFSGCSGLTSVTIPNSVTSISSSAFSGCSGLTSVTIPNSVTSIGSYAFNGCSGLTSVTIPNSVTSIGSDAFSLCSGLTSVTIPNSVTNIGSYAFLHCNGLTSVTIPNSVTSIGSYAFSGCSGLTSVTIGNSVTSIDSYAFDGCSGLKSITWNAKNYPAFSSYSSSPFYNIRTQITKFLIGDDVTSIPKYMCYGMNNLKSMTIPNSVTSIGSSAFSGCSGLEKVIVPDIKNWCSIKFGDYYSNPMQYAHHLYSDENTEITKLVIPDGVTSIGNYAFYGCSGLTSVTIPNSVTSIGSSAFSGCSGLKKVIVPDIKNWCSITFANSTANPLYYAHHLYSDENTEITELVIPNSVTSIGSYAFNGCSGLTSVTIPNSVTSIGSDAFSLCSGLTSVTIPNSVTSIGSYAFNGCRRLTSVTIPNSVTSFGSGAFNGCSGLTSVTIPNSVTSIGSSAFSGCSGLTSVTIPNSVTSIGSTIFSGCSNLTSVRFENSKDNTPIVLESNKVFSDCPLDEVYIGRKLSYTTTSSAGYSPFYRNTTLRSVKFTDKETEISDYEFYGCTNLTDVSMGDGVKSIGAYAFSGCSSLEHFTCGRQLESIGKEAFSDCTSMTKFRTRAAVPPTCGAQALDDINKWECTLYVPTESIDDYQAADQWKNFFFIEKFRVEGDSNGDDTVTMADANAIVNYFLAKGTDGFVEGDFDEETADVNEDGSVTMADANQVVNMFLGVGKE